jgi:hypothetical protein
VVLLRAAVEDTGPGPVPVPLGDSSRNSAVVGKQRVHRHIDCADGCRSWRDLRTAQYDHTGLVGVLANHGWDRRSQLVDRSQGPNSVHAVRIGQKEGLQSFVDAREGRIDCIDVVMAQVSRSSVLLVGIDCGRRRRRRSSVDGAGREHLGQVTSSWVGRMKCCAGRRGCRKMGH